MQKADQLRSQEISEVILGSEGIEFCGQSMELASRSAVARLDHFSKAEAGQFPITPKDHLSENLVRRDEYSTGSGRSA